MYEQVEKTQQAKSHMAANGVSQRKNGYAPTSRFVDKRPEGIRDPLFSSRLGSSIIVRPVLESRFCHF